MSLVNNLVVTKRGALLLDLLKTNNGTFTRFIIGEGFCYDDLTSRTEIINPICPLTIKSYEKDKKSGIVKLFAAFDNTITDEDFWYRELGLMALDPDTNEEILFAYGNANELAEYIPVAKTNKVTIRKSLILAINVGNVDNVSVIIDTSYDSYQIKAEKGQPEGYASLDEYGRVPVSQVPIFIRGCFNSGPVDENGEAALLSLDETVLTLHTPAVCTTVSGETFSVNEDISKDISDLTEGHYNVFYNPETNGLEVYANTIFQQKSKPVDWNVNDIWIDTSVMPYLSKIKISETEVQIVKLIKCGLITIEV